MTHSSPPQSPTDGMAMNWVIDHVLTHPDPYQTTLPLRTIYTLNCQTTSTSPTDFKQMLLDHLQNMPDQPCTLPPVFLTTFIKKCFPQSFQDVDFAQALTALDYLRDLELRRHKELEKAIRARNPQDAKVLLLTSKSAENDRLYAKALVGIRRWTLINELSLSKFNKFNCVALLNTLYPLEEEDVNSHLTAVVLSHHRKQFWKYIISVEKNGPEILESIKYLHGGWQHISEVVDKYCRQSLELVQKAEDLSRPTSIGSFRSDVSADIEPMSPTKLLFRRNSNESSETESVVTGKRSTLEKIVRGLSKLGGSSGSKKMYGSEWNLSSKKLHSPDAHSTHKRFDWNSSNEDVKIHNY